MNEIKSIVTPDIKDFILGPLNRRVLKAVSPSAAEDADEFAKSTLLGGRNARRSILKDFNRIPVGDAAQGR